MLSGEGNENGEKTTKKKLLDVQHTFFCTFLCRCFTRLQRETSRNFLVTRFIEEISYLFLFTLFFSLPLIFTLVAASISHFLRCKIFTFFFHKKLSPLFFISLSSSLSCFLSFSFDGLSPPFSFSLSFSFSIFQTFRHDN